MWYLFQAVSATEWDYFKISPQADTSSLVETMRTLYGPNLPQEPSLDVEMVVNELPVVEETSFTTVTGKKDKGKERLSPSTNTSVPSQNMPPPVTVVSRASLLPQPAKMATAKSTPAKVTTTLRCPNRHLSPLPKWYAVGTPSPPKGLLWPLLIQSMRAFFISVICSSTFL